MPVVLETEQKRIEEEAALTGLRRSTRAVEKAQAAEREAGTQLGSAMVKRIIGPMIELFTADLDARAAGRATKGGASLKVLRDLDPQLLCTVATREALNRMSRPEKLTAVARRIGEGLEDELRWHRWETINKPLARAVRKRVNQSSNGRQRRNALAGFARRWEKRALEDAWSSYRLIGIGLRFIDYLVRLNVLEMTKIASRIPTKKKKAAHAVRLTQQAAAWAKDMGELLAVSRPLSWPLVIPPVPWSSTVGGGFHFREDLDHPAIPRPLRPLTLVRRACKEQRAMLATADLSTVFAGVNAAQATAWRINPRVYSTLARMMELGMEAPGITKADPKPIPERPSTADTDKEVHLAWKNEARKAHKANAAMASKRLAEHRVFSTARKFVVYPEIYFAYNLDFRGRMYACSDDLSPQGNDIQRSLLEFAHGDPLDDAGARWLKIHLANCYGVDKVGFDDRVKWAEENEPMILAVANDPLGCDEWHKGDPKTAWQFLAACFAWADYKAGNLECRVPVMLDGTCSGIQHYAALLRDSASGAAVNLVPADKPGDLYADVAVKVMEILSTSTEPFARQWYEWKIDRKITKRSVMVLPYGGTFLSNLDYVRDAVRDRIAREGQPAWLSEENGQDAFVTLAKAVWQAMQEVIVGPIEGMNYVRKLVKMWAESRPAHKLHWTSPCSLPVVTEYLARKVPQTVAANVNGQALRVGFQELTDVTNWSRTETAAPPNFVHSLDASHLIFSMKRAAEIGITNLAVVHDAFGTTPTKTAEFARVLREEFAKLYTGSPLDALRDALKKLGVEPPEPPPLGDLKPGEIARSEYLFA